MLKLKEIEILANNIVQHGMRTES